MRLALVSLVAGVVLAVVSVPAADVAFDRSTRGTEGTPDIWWFESDGNKALIYRFAARSGVHWWVLSGPKESSFVRSLGQVDSGARVSSNEPRPRAMRWPLDVGEREGRYIAVGWPLRSASRGRIWSSTPGPDDAWGLSKVTLLGYELSLSTRPIWPGLLGNVLFYAVLVLTPLGLIRRRKLRRRMRLGLCEACAYELGDGVRTCPECGLSRPVAG